MKEKHIEHGMASFVIETNNKAEKEEGEWLSF